MGSKAGGGKSERAQWDSQVEFVLACVGYAVGIGNVWRFPYLCYKNGGGAFLIPYAISLLIAGIPIFYFELIIGQFSSFGPVGIFKRLAPISQGIGWGMAITSFLVGIYYNMLLGWIVLYFFLSFRTNLLWASCRNSWNTFNCHSNLESDDCKEEFGEGWGYFNKSCYNASELLVINETHHEILAGKRKGPAEEFLENYVLNLSEGFEEIGGFQWRLVVALAVAWIIVFFCLIKGVKSTGKVVYFTATFPYVVLVALMIRGVTLDGAYDGIKFYIIDVNFTKLSEIEVWKDAATQIFYSLGPAFGGLLTMSSYNKFTNNCYRDALFVSITNCCTSVFAGFAVFSIAGFMAKDLELPVKSVVRDGIGLAFVAYPEAISRMPISPLWAVLFFFMLITLGLDSQFAMTETVTTALQDQWTGLRKHTALVCFMVCLVSFLCGLPMCTRAGIYFFTLMDNFSAGTSIMILAFLEIFVAMWIYGLSNFVKDVQLMLGKPRHCPGMAVGTSGYFFRFTWKILTPLFLLAIIASTFIFYSRTKYGTYEFPVYAEAAGWCISAASILTVIIFAIYRIFFTCCGERPCSSLFKASVEWCPAHEREERVRQSYQQQKAKPPFAISGAMQPTGTGGRSGTVRPAPYHPAYGYIGHQPQNGYYGTMPGAYHPYGYGQGGYGHNPYATLNAQQMNGMGGGYYHSQTLPYGQYYYSPGMEMGTYGSVQGQNPYYRPGGTGRVRKTTAPY